MVALGRARIAAMLALAALAPLLARRALAQESDAPESIERPGTIEGSIAVHVSRARSVALVKLRRASCRSLFSAFADLDGRALDAVLAGRDETAEGHLSRIAFRDGSRAPECHRPAVLAYTTPGSLTVFVCPAFRVLVLAETRAAANVLIHEELHSLGAGEAPMPGLPTATEITRQVELTCGR